MKFLAVNRHYDLRNETTHIKKTNTESTAFMATMQLLVKYSRAEEN